ncbi:MAG: hypothetical protein E7675_00185 [Ruminococcaceae bacterium]|nr:hypothetical protein [Oscillospiraceae bacterium]
MKKIIALALVIATMLSFAACTTDNTATPTPTPTETQKTEAPATTPDPTPSATPTPSVEPTPTPSATPTPTEDLEKGMTEEEMGVLPVGRYKITIPGVDGYLSFALSENNIDNDKPLFVSKEDKDNIFTIIYQTTGENPSYTISPNDEVYHVIGLPVAYPSSSTMKSGSVVYSNYRMRYTNTTRPQTQDSYATIRWYFEPNEDGTYKMAIYSSTNFTVSNLTKYYASYEDGKIVLRKESENISTNFKLDMIERGSEQFLQYISNEGKITLRLPPKMKKEFIITLDKKQGKFTDEFGQTWANNAEDCYFSFIELTNYIPHENIIVKAYANCDYMAYVTSGYNTITASYSAVGNDFGNASTWFSNDIKEMVARGPEARDVNFGVMHEMGHMFDIGADWYFETESMTDFKLAYCLDKNGLSASPSEFTTSQYFTYSNIEEAYLSLGKDISKTNEYTFYGAAYRMILIQKELGWEPFRQTYHWFMENRTKIGTDEHVAIPTKKYEKCELFYKKVSEFAGRDVVAMIPANEWKVWLEYMGKPADEE